MNIKRFTSPVFIPPQRLLSEERLSGDTSGIGVKRLSSPTMNSLIIKRQRRKSIAEESGSLDLYGRLPNSIYLYVMKQYAQYISISPDVRFGKPCISGTRIAIADILQWLASGMSHDDILQDFPVLKEEHIRAALAFAADREAMIKMIPA